MQIAQEIALYHHEKYDGTGYPKGLKKNNIPLSARIVAVVDVFDALISKRCYKDAMSYEEAKKIILDGSGTHFDPVCIKAFEECFEEIISVYEKMERNPNMRLND